MGNKIYFKRWARKSYAVFNSLKKEIRICTLNIQIHFQSPRLLVEANVSQLFLLKESKEEVLDDLNMESISPITSLVLNTSKVDFAASFGNIKALAYLYFY